MKRGGLTLILLALAPATACLVTFDDEELGQVPGLDGVVRIDDEPAGDKCPAGGVVVLAGTDADKDGALSPGEESGVVTVVCAGVDGAAAKVVLLRIAAEAEGGECPHAGQRIESGLDDDDDGLLDDDEVEAVRHLCNGAPGATGGRALVVVSEETAGDSCALGGARVSSGIDQDGDEVLDESEIASTAYACDGPAGGGGAAGEDGSDALVEVVAETPGLACPAGGQRVDIGLDADSDGILDVEERSATSYVCNGRSLSSGGVGGELSGGVAEGTVAAPVELSVGAFAPDASSHAGTVGAGLASYYRFTTLADPVGDAGGPYSFALHDVEADVELALYEGADFASGPVTVDCVFEGARLFVCSSAPLAEGTTYYAAVTEVRNVALSYAVSVSFGARTGTGAAPAAPTTDASVHGGGVSYFDVGGAVGDVKTVRLTNVRGALDAAPALVWEQLNDGAAFPAYGTCATQVGPDIVCPTARLSHRSVIAVRETAGAGALYDVVVEDGDTVTAALALEAVDAVAAPLGEAPIRTTTTTNGGAHTMVWDRAAGTYDTSALELYPDRLSADARVHRLGACVDDCIVTVPDELAPGPLYLRAPLRTGGADVAHGVGLFPRGGNEGESGAPHALPVGIVVDGSLASTSRYVLPAPAITVRYSVKVNTYYGKSVGCRWHSADTFDAPLYEASHFMSQRYGCVSEPVAAGEPIYFTLSTLSPVLPVAYTLEVQEGDAVTPTLLMGGGLETIAGGGTEYRQISALAPGPYAIATTTTGSVRRRVFPGHPRNLDWTEHVARCESYSSSSTSSAACTLRFVAKQSVPTYYLSLFVNTYTVTLDPTPVPVNDYVVGAPAVYAAAVDASVWIVFDIATEGTYALDVTQSASSAYAVRAFSPGYEEQEFSSSASAPANTLVTFALGTLTPGRWAVEYDSSSSSALDVTLDVREVP